MMAGIRIVDLVSDNDNKRYEPAARMAEAMIDIIRDKSDCLPQDLNDKGFTPDEIAQHWHLAKSLAAVELRMSGEQPVKLCSLFWRKA